jgi:hypothetical protein
MTQNSTTFLIILCIISLCANVYLVYNIKPDTTSSQYEKARIDSLNRQISIIEIQLQNADTKINTYRDSLQITNTLVNLQTIQLRNIKNKYEKIKPTDNTPIHDVIEFFAERYN